MSRHRYRRQQRMGAGAALMIVMAVSFVVFMAVTRYGLELWGPWLHERLDALAEWFREASR